MENADSCQPGQFCRRELKCIDEVLKKTDISRIEIIFIARDKEPKPVRMVEDLAIANPDRSGWDALCGSYDTTTGQGLLETAMKSNGKKYPFFSRSFDESLLLY